MKIGEFNMHVSPLNANVREYSRTSMRIFQNKYENILEQTVSKIRIELKIKLCQK